MEQVKIDYNELFRHVEGLRKVLLIAGGRSGSDFFQSLLDGHSEILQFTGVWFFHLWWKEARCKEDLNDLINEFVWHTYFCNHIAKFKSRYEKTERWDQLGASKNESFEVDINSFMNHMRNILLDKELNSKNFFLAVNLAYGLATDVDIKKTKIIFYHIHHVEKLKEFKEDFLEFDVIVTIREPRNTLVSSVEHCKECNVSEHNAQFLYQLNRIFEESEPVLQYTKNVRVLRLEDLHLFPKEVLKEFCSMHDLALEDSMFKSSYHGKKWWGDAWSGKYLDGFNKNINAKKWKNRLFFYDNFLIEFILEDRLRHYGYPLENNISKIYCIFIPYLVFLPMKYELEILRNNFRSHRSVRGRLASIKNAVKFYILRLLLYFKYIGKKISKRIFLADFFNSKNKRV